MTLELATGGVTITLLLFTLGLVIKNTKDIGNLCGYIHSKDNSGNKQASVWAQLYKKNRQGSKGVNPSTIT